MNKKHKYKNTRNEQETNKKQPNDELRARKKSSLANYAIKAVL